jgi:hypothetical protein
VPIRAHTNIRNIFGVGSISKNNLGRETGEFEKGSILNIKKMWGTENLQGKKWKIVNPIVQ